MKGDFIMYKIDYISPFLSCEKTVLFFHMMALKSVLDNCIDDDEIYQNIFRECSQYNNISSIEKFNKVISEYLPGSGCYSKIQKPNYGIRVRPETYTYFYSVIWRRLISDLCNTPKNEQFKTKFSIRFSTIYSLYEEGRKNIEEEFINDFVVLLQLNSLQINEMFKDNGRIYVSLTRNVEKA